MLEVCLLNVQAYLEYKKICDMEGILISSCYVVFINTKERL